MHSITKRRSSAYSIYGTVYKILSFSFIKSIKKDVRHTHVFSHSQTPNTPLDIFLTTVFNTFEQKDNAVIAMMMKATVLNHSNVI